MGELIYLDQFRSFLDAAARAKIEAAILRAPTTVSRDGNQWCVAVPAQARHQIGTVDPDDSLYDHAYESALNEEQDECDRDLDEIAAEIAMAQEDWARSNEDGWYYGDDDPD